MGVETKRSRKKEDTFDDEEDAVRSTEAMPLHFGAAEGGVDDFDPDEFDVATTNDPMPFADYADEHDNPFDDVSTGTTLGGRYRLEKILGKGACGVVFEASHLIIGKKVALKCLYPALRNHPTYVERFFREARISATVEHVNVVKIFDGGDDQNTLFLAMELLKGMTLGERLQKGPLPLEEAVDLFLKILDGVAAVHAKGVIHRDLKPDNIFLTDRNGEFEGEPKVLDFGVSKLKEPGRKELTKLGSVMGTPFYMAPEQSTSSKDVDPRADVYSLGVMLYETISGQLPYEGNSVLEIFQAARRADWIPLDRLCREVPKILAKVVAKAMHADPEKRFSTVRAMHRALAAVRAADAFDEGAANRTVEDLRNPALLSPADEEDDVSMLANPPPRTYRLSRQQDQETAELARTEPRSDTLPTWVPLALGAMALLTSVAIGLALFVLLR